MMNGYYILNNGMSIPRIGMGTLHIPRELTAQSVADAISVGYRLIDTAVAYQNETEVGEGLRQSGIPREELFVTTKILPHVKTYEGAAQMIRDSLARLGCGYIDLVLIHGPKPIPPTPETEAKDYFEENLTVWKALEDAIEEGIIRSAGVSNFTVQDIRNIVENCRIKPVANQIRVHIGDVPKEIMNYCQANDILVEAYSPLGTGRVLENEAVIAMAEKYGVSTGRLALRFDIQLGVLPLPRSKSIRHLKDNLELDFTISDEDMEILSSFELKGQGF